MSSPVSFDCVLFLLLFTGSLEEAHIAEVGENAYLPCSYTPSPPGTLVPVCWGKGYCPLSRCSNLLLSSDESKVTYQKSSRYQLKGSFHQGDVSLTIQNVTLADSGTYCCRVQFPGIMNDGKFNLELVVKPATVTPSQIAQRDFTTALPRMLVTEGHGSETQTLGTLQDENQMQVSTLTEELQDSAAAVRIGAYVGAGVTAGLALSLIIGALILKWHFHRKRKLQNSSLITMASLPPMGLVNAVAERMRSEPNIYTIEENVYEVENANEYHCYLSSGRPS